jgi:sugar lactone lactonase YvrE
MYLIVISLWIHEIEEIFVRKYPIQYPLPSQSVLGECPIWSIHESCLYFVDLLMTTLLIWIS